MKSDTILKGPIFYHHESQTLFKANQSAFLNAQKSIKTNWGVV